MDSATIGPRLRHRDSADSAICVKSAGFLCPESSQATHTVKSTTQIDASIAFYLDGTRWKRNSAKKFQHVDGQKLMQQWQRDEATWAKFEHDLPPP